MRRPTRRRMGRAGFLDVCMSQWGSRKARFVLQHFSALDDRSRSSPADRTRFSRVPDGRILFSRFMREKRLGPRMMARIARLTGLEPDGVANDSTGVRNRTRRHLDS